MDVGMTGYELLQSSGRNVISNQMERNIECEWVWLVDV